MGVSPQINLFGDKLRAVVHPEALWHPILGHRQVESRDHIIDPVEEAYPDKETNTANVMLRAGDAGHQRAHRS